MNPKMLGAILPGNSTVELKEFDVPKPGHGQVLVKTKASTICGSDIRCIYRAHVGKGPEGYQPGVLKGPNLRFESAHLTSSKRLFDELIKAL